MVETKQNYKSTAHNGSISCCDLEDERLSFLTGLVMDTDVALPNMYFHPSYCQKHYVSSVKRCETKPTWCDPAPSTAIERMTGQTVDVEYLIVSKTGISIVQMSVFRSYRLNRICILQHIEPLAQSFASSRLTVAQLAPCAL